MTTRVSKTQLPKGPAAGRPAWVGTVQVGHLSAGIGLYSATIDPPRVQGTWIHLNCGEHVKCPRRCPVHGEIESTDIGTQFHVDGRRVVLTADELNQIKPPRQDTFEFSRFCPATAIHPIRCSGLNYYPIARTSCDAKSWATVLSTLRKAKACAIGEIVIRGTRSLMSLQTFDDQGCFVGLRYPEGVRSSPPPEIQIPTRNTVDQKLLRTATSRRRQIRSSDFSDRSEETLLDALSSLHQQQTKSRRPATIAANGRSGKAGASSQA